ncbi:MAG: hypothetical protein EAX96_10190 [Candidatus Lokiarchaeota archaeon]|nr:hypothetical protein [Candidatus Lokiarchaeota archaeon]
MITDPFALMAAILLPMIIIVIVWFVVGILIAVWVYKDAEAKGESGVLWLIICILLSFVGLIIWLIVRRNK